MLSVLEKHGHRTLVYIGSGTTVLRGFLARFYQYDNLSNLPLRVEDAINDGYIIVHKGLLYWSPIPPAALVPLYRLLFISLEASFAFMFWAMCAKLGDYRMGHIRLWPLELFEYDGACSHPAFNEGIPGDFDLTAEQLEAKAAAAEKKRIELEALNHTNHHHKQMETNYDEYMGNANERVARSRANNPGQDAIRQADRIEKAVSEKTLYCQTCDLPLGTNQRLQNHLKTKAHSQKAKGLTWLDSPFRCNICKKGYSEMSNLIRHRKTKDHSDKMEALVESSVKLD